MISTIIIVRNALSTIKDCVESVRAQTHKTGEIIVVDGNSEDGTTDWLGAQMDLRTIRQAGLGIAGARNQGIEAASGDFIAFLDADDVWMPQKIEGQVRFLDENPMQEGVTGNLTKTDDAENISWVAMTPGGFLFRKEVFSLFGLFNEEFSVATDHEWLLRAIRRGFTYSVLPQIVMQKNIHDGNLSIVEKKRYRTEMMSILRQTQKN